MENSYTILTGKTNEDNKISNLVIFIGSIFSCFSLWVFLSTFLDLFIHRSFSTGAFVISILFLMLGLVLLFYGLVDKVGKTTLILDGKYPVLKHLSIGKYTYGQKTYDFEDVVELTEEFPETDYPISVLIAQKSGKVLDLNKILDIKKTINSFENSRKYDNTHEIILASLFSLISIKAISLIKFKVTETMLGVSLKNNNLKERYCLLQGESYLEYKDVPELGDVENAILNSIDLKSSDLDYQDDDLFQITKKILVSGRLNPHSVIPNMARKNGAELGLFESTEERKFEIKEEYNNLFKDASDKVKEFFNKFENKEKELFMKLNKDISSALFVMDRD